MSTRETMLRIAESVIMRRAHMDGYRDGGYDPGLDEDGFITSILNALHQWCDEHGHDWTTELIRAQGIFEDDLAEYLEGQSGAVLDANR